MVINKFPNNWLNRNNPPILVKLRYILILFSFFLTAPVFGENRGLLDRPLLVGPQYPFIFLSTTFEPNTAFLLAEGDFFIQGSYTSLNTYVFSGNSAKANDPAGASDSFNPTGSNSYSVYFDGELDRRFLRLFYGFNDNIELQLTYRDIRFFPGTLDTTIENFHKLLSIGNQGRENTERDLLEVFIHDNQNQENVFSLTKSTSAFHQESMTLGIKLSIRDTATEAISFKLSSNFSDYYIEREINELSVDDQPEHSNFNDYNLSFYYTSLFPEWSLYAGFSIANVQSSLLKRSPKEIYYFFLGLNWHLSESWDFLVQTLEYSSPFPRDNVSTISADVREITAGFRLLFSKQFGFDIGLVENQSQGPQNIDIAIFSNFMLYL